jgi:hypothetical protein
MGLVDTKQLLEGALKVKEDLISNKNPYFFSLAQRIFDLKAEENITQTVLMPYSSKLASLISMVCSAMGRKSW